MQIECKTDVASISGSGGCIDIFRAPGGTSVMTLLASYLHHLPPGLRDTK